MLRFSSCLVCAPYPNAVSPPLYFAGSESSACDLVFTRFVCALEASSAPAVVRERAPECHTATIEHAAITPAPVSTRVQVRRPRGRPLAAASEAAALLR